MKTQFEQLIENLSKYGKVVHRSFFFIGIVEIVCTVTIGILAKYSDKDNIPYFLGFVIFIYLSTVIMRLYYSANYSGSIAQELNSERELQVLKKLSGRQVALSKCHFETIRNLNIQTCILDKDKDDTLCDTGVTDNLRKLLSPIIQSTQHLLNCEKGTSYTYGLYLHRYLTLTCTTQEKGIIVIHDELEKENILAKGIFSTIGLSGEQLQIQNILKTSFNNKVFHVENYSNGNMNYTMACSHMFEACNEDRVEKDLLGVLFIISEKLDTLPEDLETQMKIFNRIISNWIYSYNDCVVKRKSGE